MYNVLMRRLVTRALLVAALTWSVLIGPLAPAEASACTPLVEAGAANAEGLVPIQPLAQGNVFDHGPPRSILMVSARPDPIASVIDPADAPAVAHVDLSENVLVGENSSRVPTSARNVDVTSCPAHSADARATTSKY